MSTSKQRVRETDIHHLVSSLRGEIGEVITTWVLWRMYRRQELREQTSDLAADSQNIGLRLLGIVVTRLRDDITARLSELGERESGCVNFHFLSGKEPQYQPLAKTFTQFVKSHGIRDKRHRDISHKELPPTWKDREHRYVYDRTLTRGVALALDEAYRQRIHRARKQRAVEGHARAPVRTYQSTVRWLPTHAFRRIVT